MKKLKGFMMKKVLLLLVPLLFFISCEDDEVDYISLKSMSFSSGLNMISFVVVGYSPPSGHIEVRSCEWLRLYKDDDECDCKSPSDGSIYTKDLDGVNYSYIEM